MYELLRDSFIWHVILPAFLFAYTFSFSTFPFMSRAMNILTLMTMYIIGDFLISYFVSVNLLYDTLESYYGFEILLALLVLRFFSPNKGNRKYFRTDK